MASTAPTSGNSPQPSSLPNKPQTKLPPIPKGSRIHKRPLPLPPTSSRRRNTPASSSPASILDSTTDPDGYTPPPRATHTTVIKVSSSASFMSLVRRVRKALEKAPARQGTRGLPLTARIAALKTGPSSHSQSGGNGNNSGRGREGIISDALDDVMLVATGRAIERAVDVGGFFTREKDLVVLVRTRTVQAVDDVVAGDEEADVEDQVRVRNVSCVEVGIRWVG